MVSCTHHGLIFDTATWTPAAERGSCCDGFWRVNRAAFDTDIECNRADLQLIVSLLPNLRQLQGFTLSKVDTTKRLLFRKTAVQTVDNSSADSNMILSPLRAAKHLDTLWLSLHKLTKPDDMTRHVIGSLSRCCPALTSLTLSSCAINASLVGLSTLSLLTHLALPDYLMFAVYEWEVHHHSEWIFDLTRGPIVKRMSELAVLTQVKALCINNLHRDYVGPLERSFLELLAAEKIVFAHLNEFRLHPEEVDHRPPLRGIMPNLTVWTAAAPVASSSRSLYRTSQTARLSGIELKSGRQ